MDLRRWRPDCVLGAGAGGGRGGRLPGTAGLGAGTVDALWGGCRPGLPGPGPGPHAPPGRMGGPGGERGVPPAGAAGGLACGGRPGPGVLAHTLLSPAAAVGPGGASGDAGARAVRPGAEPPGAVAADGGPGLASRPAPWAAVRARSGWGRARPSPGSPCPAP